MKGKKETKGGGYDCRYRDYTGTKRFKVTHPAHKDAVFAAAPDENSAMIAAADAWGERWTSIDFYPYCKVVRA